MKSITDKMRSTSGTVFLFCSFRDEKSVSIFIEAAKHTGRRLFHQWEESK